MATPLRWNMILPNGEPLRWNTPGAKWNGNVEDIIQPHRPMQQNDLSITITAAKEADVIAKAEALRASIAEFAVTLTDAQRQGYFKLSDLRLPFHNKSRDYMHQQTATVPPGTIDLTEYDKDQAAWDSVGRMIAKVNTILQPLVDTQTVAGADMLNADLFYYNYLPLAARAGTPGAEDIHGDLKSVYPGRGPTPKPPTPPAH